MLFLTVLYNRGYSYGIEKTGSAIDEGLKFLEASDKFPWEQAVFFALIPWLNTGLPIEVRRKYFELAINSFRELDDEWGIGWANDYWAWAQSNAGDALSAEPHHVEALKIFQKLKDGRGTAASLSGIGYAFWTRHDYAKAQELIIEATNIIDSLDLYNEKLTYYISVIDITMLMGDFKSALEVAHQGYELSHEKGGKVWQIAFLLRMINCLIEQGEYELAQTRSKELLSIQLPDQIEHPRISGYVMRTIGFVELELNNPKQARLSFEKSIADSRQAVGNIAFQFDFFNVIRYQIIIWIARWLKRTGQYLLSAEIAYFVSMYEAYPRPFYIIIRDYKKLLHELGSRLSPEELSSAKMRAENRELESTLEKMLDHLER